MFISYMRRSSKILILNKEGIIEKISYARRAYESVDEKAYLRLCPEKRWKKEFAHLRVKIKSGLTAMLRSKVV